MTEKGRVLAAGIKHRHATLKRFLSLLGVDEQTQETDIEGWEHCLSSATLERLGDLADFLEAKPDVLEAFLRQRQAATSTRSRSAKQK